MKVAEFASKMSYSDSSLEFKTATGVHIPKRTIHSIVQEIAPQLLEASRTADKLKTVMGDTTQVRGLKSQAMNNVHVLMSEGGQLLHLGVNNDWPPVDVENLVSDNEPGLVNAVKAKRRQLGILHALKYLLFALWGERMSKDDRVEVDRAAKHILFTLVNSTEKHRKDKNKKHLKWRIRWTLRELDKIAKELEERGYPKASSFIKRNAKFMVTFAQLALEDVTIPYTNNRMERLMGEVSKRCKHKWAHWSTQGLRNILAIVLVRYTNPKLYNQFKNSYMHDTPFNKTDTAQKANT